MRWLQEDILCCSGFRFLIFYHREVHLNSHQIFENFKPFKYIHHHVFQSNINFKYYDARVEFYQINLCIELSEIFPEGLDITSPLKHCILLNSCSKAAFSANSLACTIFDCWCQKFFIVTLPEPSCHDRHILQRLISVIYMQAIWFKNSRIYRRKHFPGLNRL